MSKKIFMVVLCCILVSCTKNKSITKVVGGQNVDGEIAFAGVVPIVTFAADDKGIENCTASVISHNTLLTAAHCFAAEHEGKMRVATLVVAWITDFDSQKIVSVQSRKFFYHPNYDLNNHIGSSSVNDIALVVFDDNTFKLPLLTLSSKTAAIGSDVTLVGYGCKTETKEVQFEDGETKNMINCVDQGDDGLKLEKRAGINKVSQGGCYSSMVQVSQMKALADSEIETATGIDVSASVGDSGGPLLKFPINEPKDLIINGVCSYVNGEHVDGRFSCYANPIIDSNYQFLSKIVNENGAIIPGINMYVGMIELNGKVRVVEKQRENIYNEKMPDTPFTINRIQSGGQYCQSTGSMSGIKSCWDSLTLLEKTKLTWQ